ncbi:hypothetical protein D1872_228970 [compost metagenome]
MLPTQGFHISGRLPDHSLLSQETVTARYVAGFNPGDFKLDDFLAEQGHHPADRTDEFEIMISPAHIFRKIHRLENPLQPFGHNRFRFHPCPALADIDIFRPAEFLKRELLGIYPLTAGKTERRFTPSAVLVQGDFPGRPLHLFMDVFLFLRHPLDKDRQTAWRGVTLDGVVRNHGFLQPFLHPFLQLFHGRANKAGRHFLQADFEQKILSHGQRPLSAASGIRAFRVLPGRLPLPDGRDCAPVLYTPSVPSR